MPLIEAVAARLISEPLIVGARHVYRRWVSAAVTRTESLARDPIDAFLEHGSIPMNGTVPELDDAVHEVG